MWSRYAKNVGVTQPSETRRVVETLITCLTQDDLYFHKRIRDTFVFEDPSVHGQRERGRERERERERVESKRESRERERVERERERAREREREKADPGHLRF